MNNITRQNTINQKESLNILSNSTLIPTEGDVQVGELGESVSVVSKQEKLVNHCQTFLIFIALSFQGGLI